MSVGFRAWRSSVGVTWSTCADQRLSRSGKNRCLLSQDSSSGQILTKYHSLAIFVMPARSFIKSRIRRTAYQYICAECRFLSTTSRQTKWWPGAAQPHQELGSRVWSRGAKRKSTLTFKAVPQGSLPPKAVEIIDTSDGPVYPTVVQQARNNMQKFSHCVVLTRVGNFYEV